MEQGRDFISQPLSEHKRPIDHELSEMEQDFSVFSKKAKPIVRKYLDNVSLLPEEASILREERAVWWQDKYGFPYYQKASRQEVLRKKYAQPEEEQQANDLQERLFAALALPSGLDKEEQMDVLQSQYHAEYPDQLEGIEALLHLQSFLKLSEQLDNQENGWSMAERKQAYQELTEYQFLLTHFILGNSNNKQFLTLFWKTLEKIASDAGMLRRLNVVRKGIVTQVATHKLFEQAGMQPHLSHPSEDAFRSIDLWSDETHAVQIKSTTAQEPAILEVDEISFPGVAIQDKETIKHFNSNLFAQAQNFKYKVNEYEKLLDKNLKGYFIVIPYAKVDFVTGMPDHSLLAFLQQKLNLQSLISEKEKK